jgi:Flp pilus assembly protein TadD/4-amino-4-deoxy-L-arabinose transferase-like glycosyltransferase
MKANQASRLVLALVLGTAVFTAGWLYWICAHDNSIAFLPRQGQGQWIVYPAPPDHLRHLEKEVEALFKRSFSLGEAPANAQVSMLAFRKGTLEVNGARLDLSDSDGQNWKRVTHVDVAKHLRKGENEIRVTVANSSGPPALWLSLAAEGFSLETDSQWQASLAGAAWQPAWPASEPREERPGNLAYSDERTIPSLRVELPTLLLLASLSVLVWAGFYFGAKAWPKLGAGGLSPRHVILVLALPWLALFWNNLGFLQIGLGFDASNHVSYIEYILQNKRLPLANEGWEAYQPPLYYVICASVLNVLGLSIKTAPAAATAVLRVLGCAVGMCQIALVFACLRLLFPGQGRKQAAGLLCVAFLPPHLYLSQYVSNEMLAATLGSATIYCCLRILHEDRPSFPLYVALGVSMGAALLTKFSTVLLVPIVLVVLLARLITRRQPAARAAAGIGVMILACLAVSGWHYVRVWNAFGNPLVGNWDPAVSAAWWQEPGYRTAHSYWGFGRALVQPFRSGLHSVPDGLYSTLWGDGLYSGLGTNRPPWNHELMAAGYLLALVPALALLAGAVAALVQFLRRPSAEWFLLLSLAFLVSFALVTMTLRIPSYAQAKAFYGLVAAVPLAAFAAIGFDLLPSRWRFTALPLFVILGTWALAGYLALWVHGKSADAQAWVGWTCVREGDLAKGEQHFRQALKADAHHVSAQVGLGTALARSGRAHEARELFARAVRDHPDNGECYVALARAEDQSERAIVEFRKALELEPDHPSAHAELANLLQRHGRTEEAISSFRQALRVTPFSAQPHTGLALALSQVGEPEAAASQFRIALILQPDDLAALENLAWMRATHPEPRLRDGAEAVRLAERACTILTRDDARLLDVLAAAYAEAGRWNQAETTIARGIQVAGAAGQTDLLAAMQQRLTGYRMRQPWRESVDK